MLFLSVIFPEASGCEVRNEVTRLIRRGDPADGSCRDRDQDACPRSWVASVRIASIGDLNEEPPRSKE
jgi:hypothetical protein